MELNPIYAVLIRQDNTSINAVPPTEPLTRTERASA
jgi:hypothetical protein